MQITVKSSQVVKTGTNKAGDWELIKVTSEDGTGYATFDKKAKHLGTGAVIDIGEVDIKDGKISFKEVVSVVKDGTSPALTNGYGQDSPEKRRSIETQCAVKVVMEYYTQMCVAEKDVDGRLIDLVDRALVWCGTRIPHLSLLSDTKSPKEQPADTEPSSAQPGEDFKNAGDFWKQALDKWGKAQSDLIAILELTRASDVKDFRKAWEELEKKLG
jgi:hypothetical protein